MIEYSRLDWENYKAPDNPYINPTKIPAAIDRLLNATDAQEAQKAYYGIDNISIVQGTVYDAALPMTICMMTCLPRFPAVSITPAFSWLTQINEGSWNSAGNRHPDVKTACTREMYKGSHIFFELILSCDSMGVSLCSDLLVDMHELTQDEELRRRSIWYLSRRDDLDAMAKSNLEYFKEFE